MKMNICFFCKEEMEVNGKWIKAGHSFIKNLENIIALNNLNYGSCQDCTDLYGSKLTIAFDDAKEHSTKQIMRDMPKPSSKK